MTETDEILASLTGALRADHPGFAKLLDEGRAAGEPEHVVIARAAKLAETDPDFAESLQRISRALGGVAPPTQHAQVVIPAPSGRGLPRLNPLFEAALQARLQFDGAAPALRYGAMPEGASPAVSVSTTARDPVAIGAMLEQASAQVSEQVRLIEEGRASEVEALGGDEAVDALVVAGDPKALALIDRDTLRDPEGYERGRVPAPSEVAPLEGSLLATLTTDQRHQLAWRFLSTTQGRRSATGVVRELLSVKLRGEGHDVVLLSDPPGPVRPEDLVAHAEWTVNLSGPKATQPAFSFIEVAAAALAIKLADSMAAGVGSGNALEVVEVNTVDVRSVGWAARVRRLG